MHKFKLLLMGLALLSSLVLTGCQGDNSDIPVSSENGTSGGTSGGTDGTLPIIPDANATEVVTIILPVANAELTKNSDSFNIVVKAIDSKNRPYSSGNMEIVFPNDVRNGRDVGYFTAITVPLDNKGEAIFVYNGPVDLIANTSDIVFGFFHDSNPSSVLTYTMSVNPAPNQPVNNKYSINTGVGSDVTMLPEDEKNVNYAVVDENGIAVTNENITSIIVTTLNPNIATLREGVTNGNNIAFAKNNVSLSVISKTRSGIVPISVAAIFKDANGIDQTITTQFNIVVLSGPPSALSISYESTKDAADIPAGFTENWIVKVTDKYNNVVNTNPSVSMGLLSGYAVDSSSAGVGAPNNYLYFESGGILSNVNNDFKSGASVFNNVNAATDTLVTFGDGYTYPASGKWDFTKNNGTTLDLIDTYDGNDTSNLGFAVGHNYRQDPQGGEAIATIKPRDNNFLLNSSGYMTLEISYDYYLTGKDVVLWVNLIGEDLKNGITTKIGEAKKVTLRAHGLQDDTITTSANAVNINYTFLLRINNSPEAYRDANFALKYALSDKLQLNSVTTSNGTLNGQAFITFNVTDVSTTGTAGTITISDGLVSSEF